MYTGSGIFVEIVD